MVAAMSSTPASTSKALNSSKARFHSASDLSVMSMPGSIRQNRSGQIGQIALRGQAVGDVAHHLVHPEDLLDDHDGRR